jgi:hypothetical protein
MNEEEKNKAERENNRVCPRCREGFHCDEAEGCWCEKLALDRATLKFLRTNYLDCLCENCLISFQVNRN